MKTTTIKKINNCNTLKEYLTVLQNEFDVKNCKPSFFIKQQLIIQILNKVPKQSPLSLEFTKNKCLQSENLNDFINVLTGAFNLNSNLTPDAKKELVKNTEAICTLTRLKENPEISKASKNTEEKKEISTSEKLINFVRRKKN